MNRKPRRSTRRKRRWLEGSLLGILAVSLPPAALGQITFLNAWGSSGSTNGEFSDPLGVAVGPDGTVYVADNLNNRVQYFTPTGVFAGTFGSVGTESGLFKGPAQIAVSSAGLVYVTDFGNNRVQEFSSLGVFQASFGSAGNGAGEFAGPDGIALGPGGSIYVTDAGNNRVEVFNSSQIIQMVFGSQGSGNNQFETPISIAVSPAASVYVSDFSDSRLEVFSANSVFQSVLGGPGTGNGQFASPNGIASDANGNIYVVDEANDRLQTFTSANLFQSAFGSQGTGNGLFNHPGAVAVAPTGLVYVTDQANQRVQRLFAPRAWVSGVNNFTDPTVGPTSVSVGPAQILGLNLTLNSTMGLNAQALTVQSGGSLLQSGGQVSTGALTVSGIYDYLAGSFAATATGASITVNSGGIFSAAQGGFLSLGGSVSVTGSGAQMVLDSGTNMDAPGGISVGPGAVVDIGNSVVSSGAGGLVVSTGGEVELANPSDSIVQLPSGTLSNSGLLTGSGRIVGALQNTATGQITAPAAADLTITGPGSTNAGQINLAGGNIHFLQNLTNQNAAQINGNGSLQVDGGLINNGFVAVGGLASYLYGSVANNAGATLALSGSAYVFNNLTNLAGGAVRLSGNTPNVVDGTFANSGALNVDPGAIGLLYGSYSGTGTILNDGSLFVHANSIAGQITGGGSLTLGDVGVPAGLQLLPLNALSTQGSLAITSGSSLDLANNALLLNFASPARDPASSIVAELRAGYNAGAWTGAGITSSSAAANAGKFALGYADGNTDLQTPAAANQFLIEYTLAGDANLDGSVGFADLVAVAQNFGATGKDWAHGNFTYDPSGSVGFADLVLVAQEFGQTTPVPEAEAPPIALSPVWQLPGRSMPLPEPASVGLVMAGAFGLLRPRRRRRSMPGLPQI